jgi:hypothetical protein
MSRDVTSSPQYPIAGKSCKYPVERPRQRYREEMNEGLIRIEVKTRTGTFIRTIRPATLLPEGVARGPEAEAATRGAAAFYGLPDFVFHPALERRGPGVREIGDALLVAGPQWSGGSGQSPPGSD